MKVRFILGVLSALAFTPPALAGPVVPDGPIDAWFHFVGMTEFAVFETPRVYSESEGTFVSGPTMAVEGGIIASELWIGAWFDAVQHVPGVGQDEWTATGKLTSISGTQAGARLGEPLTASLILAPFGIGVFDDGTVRTAGIFQSNAEITVIKDMMGEWAVGIGELAAEGIKIETLPDGALLATLGLLYQFEIEAELHSDGTNMVRARELLQTNEVQGSVPPTDGTVLLETRVVSVFEGSLVETVIHPTSIAEPGMLALFGLGLVGLAAARWRRAA